MGWQVFSGITSHLIALGSMDISTRLFTVPNLYRVQFVFVILEAVFVARMTGSILQAHGGWLARQHGTQRVDVFFAHSSARVAEALDGLGASLKSLSAGLWLETAGGSYHPEISFRAAVLPAALTPEWVSQGQERAPVWRCAGGCDVFAEAGHWLARAVAATDVSGHVAAMPTVLVSATEAPAFKNLRGQLMIKGDTGQHVA